MPATESNFTRFVEVGRVVLLKAGPQAGHIAVISEIIDHNRVRSFLLSLFLPLHNLSNRFICHSHDLKAIIDGPTTGVPRQSFPYKHLTLTPLRLTKLPRAAGSGAIKKQLEAEAIVEKWEKSAWAQKRAATEKRRNLTDFQRFVVLIAKKRRTDAVRKGVYAAKKSA
ncbi:60S ribosomal protein L14 [Irpex rosettiformis]|uniref:60S ribosomal protein L14 n=1 Tax=Irpex rosettiformis TaxID=378272 RepID=A0ACB8U3L8_9APHY|nr:60S ribosomal protein L14 [Irpex rosettiformis]